MKSSTAVSIVVCLARLQSRQVGSLQPNFTPGMFFGRLSCCEQELSRPMAGRKIGFNSADLSLLIRYPAIGAADGAECRFRVAWQGLFKCFLRAVLLPLRWHSC
jgi:hypothetical protein